MRKNMMTLMAVMAAAVITLSVPVSAASETPKTEAEKIVIPGIDEVETEKTTAEPVDEAVTEEPVLETTTELETESEKESEAETEEIDVEEPAAETEEAAEITTEKEAEKKDPWFHISFKKILIQLIGAIVLFVIPGYYIYAKSKK